MTDRHQSGTTQRPVASPVLWRADASQIAHAFRHRDTRTLCGRPVTPERLAWPVANVCPVCRERAEVA